MQREMQALTWHVSMVLAVLVVPSAARFGKVFWQAPGQNGWIVLVLGATYLFTVATTRFLVRRVASVQRATAATLATAACLLAVFCVLVLFPPVDYSRAVVGVATLIVIVGLAGHALAAGAWLGYAATWFTFAIAFLVLGVGYASLRSTFPDKQGPRRETATISASQHILTAVTYSDYFPSQVGAVVTGGALTPDPGTDGYIFARANGSIYRLSWTAHGDLRVTDSGVQVPLNLAQFSADVLGKMDNRTFRVADVVARREGGATRIFISHHFWKREQKCFVVRVSTTTLPAPSIGFSAREGAWQTVFETEPCLPVGASRGAAFAGKQAGGNLEFLDEDKLLLTVGDHQFDGWYRPTNYVQDPKAHYGKTVLIDVRTRTSSIFTIGHRNPQGLTVDSHGRVWSTEHGPQGGDELNLLRKGGNYGYPMHTYGTEYASISWPPAEGVRPDLTLIRPVFAWVPSIAPTDLVEVSDPAFPRWRGDLLIATLRGRAMWRVRVEGQRVVYAEPIPIGKRIRDIAAGKGEFVLLTNDDEIVRIVPNVGVDQGAVLFTLHCGGCHDDVEHRIGPNLKGVVGARVASSKGYEYSRALKRVGGRWTEARLAEFIADPQLYVPGTPMATDGIRDAETRQRIIDYIKYFY